MAVVKVFVLSAAIGLWSAVAALATPVEELAKALKLPQLFDVLAEEGLSYGETLESEVFAEAGGQRWRRIVAEIHQADRLEQRSMARLTSALTGQEELVAQMTRYFSSEAGRKVIDFELAARQALIDIDVQQAAEDAHARMQRKEAARAAQYEALIASNDLIEQNVAGALNSNMAFYRGMLAGGGVAGFLPEGDMMADLWAQEPEIRSQTQAWMDAYVTLAYGGLSLSEIEGYVAFSRSAAGQALNRALFAAFNETFDATSFQMGLAVARFSEGQDI